MALSLLPRKSLACLGYVYVVQIATARRDSRQPVENLAGFPSGDRASAELGKNSFPKAIGSLAELIQLFAKPRSQMQAARAAEGTTSADRFAIEKIQECACSSLAKAFSSLLLVGYVSPVSKSRNFLNRARDGGASGDLHGATRVLTRKGVAQGFQRRAVLGAAAALAMRSASCAFAEPAEPELACPRSRAATASGCVSSLPSGAPEQNVSPLRYSCSREKAIQRLRAILLAKDAELLEDSDLVLRARLPSLEKSQPGLQEELTFKFLPDDPLVIVRILSDKPYVTPPFCLMPGCMVGNAAQRKRLEDIRADVGFFDDANPWEQGQWNQVFFPSATGSGISLEDD